MAFVNVIRSGKTMLVLTPIRREDSPGDFWGIVGALVVIIGAAATAWVIYFVRWISN